MNMGMLSILIIAFHVLTIFPMEQEKTAILWDGKRYKDHSQPQFDAALALLNDPLCLVRPEEHILDIGSGSGAITDLIAEKASEGSVIGIDKSASMVESARELFTRSNLEFLVQDVAIGIDQGFFDRVTAFSCLHWMINKEKVFADVYRALKQNGCFMGTMALKNERHPLFRVAHELKKSPVWGQLLAKSTVFSGYEPLNEKEMRILLEQAGFKADCVQECRTLVAFDSKEELVNWIDAWVGGFKSVEQLGERRMEFVTQLVDTYIELFPQMHENGVYKYEKGYLKFVARK